jgi:SHS2 domain-containing protein
MPYEIPEHAADVRVRVHAGTLEALFSDAVRAMNEILGSALLQEDSAVTAEIALEAPDATALLIDFLNDVLLQTGLQRTAFRNIASHTTAASIHLNPLQAGLAGS